MRKRDLMILYFLIAIHAISISFKMPYETENKIKVLNKEIEKLNNEIKLIESLTGDIGKLKVREEEFIKEIEELNSLIEQAKTVKRYNENTVEYSKVKNFK